MARVTYTSEYAMPARRRQRPAQRPAEPAGSPGACTACGRPCSTCARAALPPMYGVVTFAPPEPEYPPPPPAEPPADRDRLARRVLGELEPAPQGRAPRVRRLRRA